MAKKISGGVLSPGGHSLTSVTIEFCDRPVIFTELAPPTKDDVKKRLRSVFLKNKRTRQVQYTTCCLEPTLHSTNFKNTSEYQKAYKIFLESEQYCHYPSSFTRIHMLRYTPAVKCTNNPNSVWRKDERSHYIELDIPATETIYVRLAIALFRNSTLPEVIAELVFRYYQ